MGITKSQKGYKHFMSSQNEYFSVCILWFYNSLSPLGSAVSILLVHIILRRVII